MLVVRHEPEPAMDGGQGLVPHELVIRHFQIGAIADEDCLAPVPGQKVAQHIEFGKHPRLLLQGLDQSVVPGRAPMRLDRLEQMFHRCALKDHAMGDKAAALVGRWPNHRFRESMIIRRIPGHKLKYRPSIWHHEPSRAHRICIAVDRDNVVSLAKKGRGQFQDLLAIPAVQIFETVPSQQSLKRFTLVDKVGAQLMTKASHLWMIWRCYDHPFYRMRQMLNHFRDRSAGPCDVLWGDRHHQCDWGIRRFIVLREPGQDVFAQVALQTISGQQIRRLNAHRNIDRDPAVRSLPPQIADRPVNAAGLYSLPFWWVDVYQASINSRGLAKSTNRALA